MLPRYRLSFLIEIVAGLALGFAGVRFALRDFLWPSVNGVDILMYGVPYYFNPFVCSLSLCGLAALVAERLGDRVPLAYGFGRRTWALSGSFMLVYTLHQLWLWLRDAGFTNVGQVDVWLRSWLINGTRGAVTSVIVAGWLTCLLSPGPKDVTADGREWTGRLFGILVVSWSMVLHALSFCRFKGWL